jgi:hypothetical protein
MFTALFMTVCLHARGVIVFGHFEAKTPIWRRVVERGLVARTTGHPALTARGRVQAQELLRLEQLQTL